MARGSIRRQFSGRGVALCWLWFGLVLAAAIYLLIIEHGPGHHAKIDGGYIMLIPAALALYLAVNQTVGLRRIRS